VWVVCSLVQKVICILWCSTSGSVGWTLIDAFHCWTNRVTLDASWNMMSQAQKPNFVFRRKWRFHFNRPEWRQFSRLLATEVCGISSIMLDTPRSEIVWRVLATLSIRQFPLQFPYRASPCAITFQLESNNYDLCSNPVTSQPL
jgi:hypothetical protein